MSGHLFSTIGGRKNKFNKREIILAVLKEIKLGEGHLAIHPVKEKSYYYYKRWLWLIFPWACLSVDTTYNFSDFMKKCYFSDQRAIKPIDDKELSRKVQMISIEAKLKKNMILSKNKKDYLINPSSLNPTAVKNKKREEDISLDDMESSISMRETITVPRKKSINYSPKENIKIEQSDKSLGSVKTIRNNFYLTGVIDRRASEANLNGYSVDGMLKRKGSQPTRVLRGNTSSAYLFDTTDMQIRERFKKKAFDINIQHHVSVGLNSAPHEGMISNLREALGEKAKKQIFLMKNKRDFLQLEYDKLVDKTRKASTKLENLVKYHNEIIGKEASKHIKFKKKEKALSLRVENAKENHKVALEQEKRLQKIIEICFINKDKNERWIRSLNYLIKNMKIMISTLQGRIASSKHEIREIIELEKITISQNLTKWKQQEKIIDTFTEAHITQKEIDKNFYRMNSVKPLLDNNPQGGPLPEELSSNLNYLISKQRSISYIKSFHSKKSQARLKTLKSLYKKLRISFPLLPLSPSRGALSLPGFSVFKSSLEGRQSLTSTLFSAENELSTLSATLGKINDKLEFFEYMRDEKCYGERREKIASIQQVKEKFEKTAKNHRELARKVEKLENEASPAANIEITEWLANRVEGGKARLEEIVARVKEAKGEMWWEEVQVQEVEQLEKVERLKSQISELASPKSTEMRE